MSAQSKTPISRESSSTSRALKSGVNKPSQSSKHLSQAIAEATASKYVDQTCKPHEPLLLASESVRSPELVLSSEPHEDICYEPFIYCLKDGKATEDYRVGTFSNVEDANDALCKAFRKIYCLYECDYDMKYDEQDGIRTFRIQVVKDYNEDAGDYVSERASSDEEETYWGERDDPNPVEKSYLELLRK